MMRVGGRLRSNVDFIQKHPIVLPSDHPLTRLTIINEYTRNLHSGSQFTLSTVRLKYWSLKGRSVLRKMVHDCVTCFKVDP